MNSYSFIIISGHSIVNIVKDIVTSEYIEKVLNIVIALILKYK